MIGEKAARPNRVGEANCRHDNFQLKAGEGQIPGICEVPLESFMPATDKLVEAGCTRIAYVGTSKGAEAALLLAVHDPRIDTVIAFSPSSVVWANSSAFLFVRLGPSAGNHCLSFHMKSPACRRRRTA
jgi:hypothetical protein